MIDNLLKAYATDNFMAKCTPKLYDPYSLQTWSQRSTQGPRGTGGSAATSNTKKKFLRAYSSNNDIDGSEIAGDGAKPRGRTLVCTIWRVMPYRWQSFRTYCGWKKYRTVPISHAVIVERKQAKWDEKADNSCSSQRRITSTPRYSRLWRPHYRPRHFSYPTLTPVAHRSFHQQYQPTSLHFATSVLARHTYCRAAIWCRSGSTRILYTNRQLACQDSRLVD